MKQQTKLSKRELLDLLNDSREYEPPPFFVTNPFNEKEIFRTNYLGYTEYLNPLAVKIFFGIKRPNPPKFNLRDRKKNLILHQNVLIEQLDSVFAFPASIDFYYVFSELLINQMVNNEGNKYRPFTNMVVQSKWYLVCITALLLKKYFGGNIIDIKGHNLSVQLQAVPYDVYIYNKVHDANSNNFHEWVYSLFFCLWRYSNEAKDFDEPYYIQQLGDYVKQRYSE